jgi:hypothetical protein
MSLEDYSLMREVIGAIRKGLPEADPATIMMSADLRAETKTPSPSCYRLRSRLTSSVEPKSHHVAYGFRRT